MVVRRRRKTNPLNIGFKERTIRDDLNNFLKLEYNIDMISNSKIEGGSSKRRPDILINCDGYCIIIEVDERQHRSYSSYSKELNDERVNDLINDLQGRKLVLIRFNPDSYKSGGKKYRSLFSKMRGDRIYRIGCPKKYEERMNTLKALLVHHLTNSPEKSFTEYKLYYDKFESRDATCPLPRSDFMSLSNQIAQKIESSNFNLV